MPNSRARAERPVSLGRSLWRALALSAPMILTACGAGTVGDPGGGENASPSVTAVVIAPTALTLTAGDQGSLTATLTTAGATPAGGWTTTWQSSDTTIVAVSSSGALNALNAGSATITATAGGKSATAVVTVKPNITSVAITVPFSKFVAVGATRALTATVTSPSAAPAGGWTVDWTTSNPAIATVASTGTVTAVAPGTDTITATVGGKSASVALDVLAQPGVIALSLNSGDFSLQQAYTYGLNAQATLVGNLPPGGLVFAWTSSDPTVATVAGTGEDAMVTGVAQGSATITATGYGKSASVKVTVLSGPPLPPGTVSAIALDNPYVLTWPGNDFSLAALVTASIPEPASRWPVLWTTADPAVATIGQTNGEYTSVTGVGNGKTTVTAALQGKSAVADVYVATLTSFSFSPATQSIPMGSQSTLTTSLPTVGPMPPGVGWSVSWSSSSPLVATVSPAGVVSAVGVGKTRIGGSAAGKSQTAVITVTGTPPTLTLSTPDTLQGTVVASTSGYILQCIHKVKVTVTGPGVVVGTDIYQSIDGAPYAWTGIGGWGSYSQGVPANDLTYMNTSGPVASPAQLVPRAIGIQFHYAYNADFADVKTLADDNVTTVNFVCKP